MNEQNKRELDFLLLEELTEKEEKKYKKTLGKLIKYFKNELSFILKKDQMEISYYIKSLNNYFVSNNGILKDFEEIEFGEIYKTNLLLTHSNDTAYIHPIIILGKLSNSNGDWILGIPGTTNYNYAKKAFHHTLNPLGDTDYFYLTKEETNADRDGTFFVTNAKFYPVEAIIQTERIGKIEDGIILETLKKNIFGKMFPQYLDEVSDYSLEIERVKYTLDLYNYYSK